MKTLGALIAPLKATGLLSRSGARLDNDVSIDHLSQDSRKITRNGLFVAVRGNIADGHMFIDKAVNNGAVAIVCEEVPGNAHERFAGTYFARVKDSRHALAVLARNFYDLPDQELQVFGVTGTNGKTTTSALIHHMLTKLGVGAGLIGTIEERIGEKAVPATLTTPDPVHIHGLFRLMRDENCSHAVMEVSSHALDQKRVEGIRFSGGIFTNLSRDHLDYHHSFEAYLAAKRTLFEMLPEDAVAIYNADDPAASKMMETTRARRISYGFDPAADVPVEMVSNSLQGLTLTLAGRQASFPLIGKFNAYNLAAAFTAGTAMGFDEGAVLDALASAPQIPGRFELMRFAGDVVAVVDYAHTPDALENVLLTLRNTRSSGQKIWLVFGCGGNRDVSKRRTMGSVAEQLADQVIVTSDNPRHEDPEAIMNDIRRGMNSPNRAQWIVDRREAIRFAAHEASPGDVVLIAGKGHETYQIIGDRRYPFDDREEVRESFSNRSASSG